MVCTFCLLVVSYSYLFSQNHILKRYTIEDGLPSSHVYQVNQDEEGNIWICTPEGISRYNGYTFRNYTVNDGLEHNDVWSFTKDHHNRLWLGTFEQITYIENSKIFKIDSELTSIRSIYKYAFQRDSSVYVNILLYAEPQNNKVRLSYVKLDPSSDSSQYFTSIQDYFFLVENKHGIWSLRNDDHPNRNILYCDTEPILELDAKPLINASFNVADDHSFSINLRHSIVLINDKEHTIINRTSKNEPFNILSSNEINDSLHYYYADDSKSFILNVNTGTTRPVPSYTGSDITAIFEDKDGNWWMSSTNGLYLLTAALKNAQTVSGIDENHFVALTKSANHIYGATIDDQILKLKADSVIQTYHVGKYFNKTFDKTRQILHHNSTLYILKSNEILQLKFDDISNQIIESTLLTKNTKQLNNASYSQGFKSMKVSSNNEIFVSSSNGIYKVIGEQLVKINSDIKTSATSYLFSEDSTLYIGGIDGLNVKHSNRLLQNPLKVSISDLELDKQNRLWVSSYTDGLCYYNPVSHKIYSVKETKYQAIKGIHISDDESVFLSTNRGAYRIFLKSVSPFRYSIEKLSVAQGLVSNEVHDITSHGDYLYLATTEGLTVINRDNLNKINATPELTLTGVVVNNEEEQLTSNYSFQPNENNIRFSYISKSFSHPHEIDYKTRMIGIDSTWSSSTSLTKEFSALAPGNYIFQVKALHPSNKESNVLAVDIEIRKPWYKRPDFLALLSLFTAILSVFLVKSYYKRSERKIEAKNHMLMLELKALHSQLNPHFIFNALNSIQHFIFTNDNIKTNKYISKFSKLMRLILDASRERTITLEHEIKMLTLYLDIEKMRFGDSFKYEIILSKTLDMQKIRIPSMYIQPFVENAVNHGFSQLDYMGYLTLSFHHKGDYILVDIQDNGVGRSISQNDKSDKEGSSRSMQILQERIKLENDNNKHDCELNIEDLAIGTKVSLRLKVLNALDLYPQWT